MQTLVSVLLFCQLRCVAFLAAERRHRPVVSSAATHLPAGLAAALRLVLVVAQLDTRKVELRLYIQSQVHFYLLARWHTTLADT